MKPEKSSDRLGRDAYRGLVREAKEAERCGKDVSPGTPEFWRLVSTQLEEISNILSTVHTEVAHERAAMESTTEQRQCLECGAKVVKKFKRGRWPIYCDNCRSDIR